MMVDRLICFPKPPSQNLESGVKGFPCESCLVQSLVLICYLLQPHVRHANSINASYLICTISHKERPTPPALENTVKPMLWSNPHKIGNIYYERIFVLSDQATI